MTFEFPCIEIPAIPDPLELQLPAGISIEHINLMEVIQPALTPLMPMFNIIDAIVAVFNCVSSITDPIALAQCIPELAKKVDKLLRLIPQLSLPYTLIGILDLLIDTLSQVRGELLHLQQQMIQITGVIDRATELDDAALMSIASCAQANVAQEAANVGKALASLGKLIGLFNAFSGMIGGPEIPDLSDVAGTPLDQAIEPIDKIVDVLQAARKAIPIP